MLKQKLLFTAMYVTETIFFNLLLLKVDLQASEL